VGESFPELELPAAQGATWRKLLRRGEPEEEIVRAAEAEGADLVLMASAGPNSLGEVLRGSTTERVLRRLPCCLCAVPAAAQRT
jgi:nucleotide-binding universal stress UspA family protein